MKRDLNQDFPIRMTDQWCRW